ncbi:hypothetical protein ACOI92_13235 [Corynebacterium striatum]|uniref:hypothetical protein n=1 Tax=Corynebacterium striatum TaxID=43770 RepID=UPI003B5A03CF
MEDRDNFGVGVLDAPRGGAGGVLKTSLHLIAPGIDVINGELALALVQGIFDCFRDVLVLDVGHNTDARA